jgi:hypothetical protein
MGKVKPKRKGGGPWKRESPANTQKAKPRSREVQRREAIVKTLSVQFEIRTDELQLMKWDKDDEELLNTLQNGRDRDAALYWAGFLTCKLWMVGQVFPSFIRRHATNIEAAPYARKAVIAEHAWQELGVQKRDLKHFLAYHFPSQDIRKARLRLYPSGVTKKDYEKVLREEFDGESFEAIAQKTGFSVSFVEQIMEAAKRAKKHVNTPLRDGMKVLALHAEKPTQGRKVRGTR